MENQRVKVIDSPMGTGKTTFAINYINSLPKEVRVIYITPFLDEVERIKQSCSDKKFVSPDKKMGKGSKRNHLLELIENERNIVSTHSLFSTMDDDMIDKLSRYNYILILDEVMNVLDKFDLWEELEIVNDEYDETKREKTKKEIDMLVAKGAITIDADTGQIFWIDYDNQWGKYETLRLLAEKNLLFLIDGDIIVWTFPIDVFREGVFDEVYILTYQFDWQIQAAYYKYFPISTNAHIC